MPSVKVRALTRDDGSDVEFEENLLFENFRSHIDLDDDPILPRSGLRETENRLVQEGRVVDPQWNRSRLKLRKKFYGICVEELF